MRQKRKKKLVELPLRVLPACEFGARCRTKPLEALQRPPCVKTSRLAEGDLPKTLSGCQLRA
jgi:hypothetical protein